MFPFVLTAALLLLASPPVAAQGTSKDYPPGWNGEATSPPMGWRSWNAFGAAISNDTMVKAIDALVSKNWTVDGKLISLADAGYSHAGIDEGWENCSGSDPNNGLRQHDEDGFPMVNTDKFPDLKWLVDYGHKRGLKMGWYLNGCACGERKERLLNYQGDVQRLHEYGFDAAKFDGCGAATNMTYYAELMAATGRTYEIENCHWGSCGEDKWYHNPDGSSCPTKDWCPFNHYRTSGDINSGLDSWLSNLQTTIKFQAKDAPLSVPSCWACVHPRLSSCPARSMPRRPRRPRLRRGAHILSPARPPAPCSDPDMMEVGRINGGNPLWSRAHFGAWCVISAPLILGLDLTDTAKLAPIIPYITNPEAIAVNQQWSGHPGRNVANITAPSGSLPVQAWVKPQPSSNLAVYVLNPCPDGNASVELPFATLGLSGSAAHVRDIWARDDLADATGGVLQVIVPPMDSVFLLLEPTSGGEQVEAA